MIGNFDFFKFFIRIYFIFCGGTYMIYDSVLVGPRLHGVATGGIGDSFVLLPRILWYWVSFARAFLRGRLIFY